MVQSSRDNSGRTSKVVPYASRPDYSVEIAALPSEESLKEVRIVVKTAGGESDASPLNVGCVLVAVAALMLAAAILLAVTIGQRFTALGSIYLFSFVRNVLKRSRPARASFDIESDKVEITLHDPDSDTASTIDLHRRSAVEIRANRFEPGLYIDAPGQLCETILEDLPEPLIDWLGMELKAALNRHSRTGDLG